MKSVYSLLLAFSLLASYTSMAQKEIVFESHTKSKHKTKHDPDGKNVITLGLLSYFSGYTPIYYERKITDFMSIEAGLGVSYRSYLTDFGMLVWNEGSNSDLRVNYPDRHTDIEDDYASYKYRKAANGTFFSIAPKFYPRDEALDGFYLSPAIQYIQYRFTDRIADETPFPLSSTYYSSTTQDDDIARSNTTVAEKMNCLDLTLNSGGVFQLRGHVALSWNIGFGLRHASSERLDIGIIDDGTTGHFVNTIRKYTVDKPLCTFGFSIGGWF